MINTFFFLRESVRETHHLLEVVWTPLIAKYCTSSCTWYTWLWGSSILWKKSQIWTTLFTVLSFGVDNEYSACCVSRNFAKNSTVSLFEKVMSITVKNDFDDFPSSSSVFFVNSFYHNISAHHLTATSSANKPEKHEGTDTWKSKAGGRRISGVVPSALSLVVGQDISEESLAIFI